jgi:hypothetical protein
VDSTLLFNLAYEAPVKAAGERVVIADQNADTRDKGRWLPSFVRDSSGRNGEFRVFGCDFGRGITSVDQVRWSSARRDFGMDKDKRQNSERGGDSGAKHAKKDHATAVGKSSHAHDSSEEKKDDFHDHKRRRDTL